MSKERFPSIVTKYTEMCLICNAPATHQHHCLSGKNRQFAESENIVVGLCDKHHNMWVGGKPHGYSCDVHHCRNMEILMKALGQMAWEKHYLCEKYSLPFTEDEDEAREAFRKANGESYL